MNSKLKFRVGEIVYHRNLDLGIGRVRYVSRDDVIVNFENAPVQRYRKYEICKSVAQRTTNASTQTAVTTTDTASPQAA